MSDNKMVQKEFWESETVKELDEPKKVQKARADKKAGLLPEKLAKAVRLPVPDFSDPNRRLTCLEVDFPIAQINALSNLEGNAGKPIYQMSKWWARRRSSVFRSMLVAAATTAPDDPSEAAKLVWDHYYCNHQKAGSFKKLKVLDCFMGGGTTLVEGSRLGMQMTGVDLNPVAWLVVKNELACSDPEQVRSLFDHIEKQVKPQIQPFYTTTCPRGHKGKWIDVETGAVVDVDPINLPPDQRYQYRWEGPEVIYTFWAKHGPCQAKGCGHRTPIFRTPVISEKKLSTAYAELTCPDCATAFHAELGEIRMAPGAERIVAEDEFLFTELSQSFAKLLNDYDKGSASETLEKILVLKEMINEEKGLKCPKCGIFSGKKIAEVLDRHSNPNLAASQRKKKDFRLGKKSVQMYLLIHPEWLKGSSGFDGDKELGGWAGAPVDETAKWFDRRTDNLHIIEVRSKVLPDQLSLADRTIINTCQGSVPKKSQFTCASCGKSQDRLSAIKKTGHTAPLAVYALQCHCPQCEVEGYTYGGRYFKKAESVDIHKLNAAEREWLTRMNSDLSSYWPRSKIAFSMRTHVKDPLPNHGYTHWWMLFNNRQLLVHSHFLKAITEIQGDLWPLDIIEQAIGVFQQYLRNQNMFSIWNIQRDTPEPFFSEGNYNPKNLTIENCVFPKLGRGNWQSSSAKCIDALKWAIEPWERSKAGDSISTKSITVETEDPIIPGASVNCGSSTDIGFICQKNFDLIITDPPFGNNYYYADLSDFFYVWLRIPLLHWYKGLREAKYFEPERTPHSMEAVDNPAEHPDDREDYEKRTLIEQKHLPMIRNLTGDDSLVEKESNPLYRPQPSSDFYCQTLSTIWSEAGRVLKTGGIMAFTFHHDDDQAWIDVLKALFSAGYVLLQTFPVIGDESKGENASFGSKKIEYDIIHVCRKRVEDPEPVSWARMRRWVKDETLRLKQLLEHTHGKNLPESDLRVILRGKSLEFYSRHYGQVLTGDGQILDVREALLGINQLLDDLLETGISNGGMRPPESAEPASRLYLRIFRNKTEMERDELHKMLRGTGFSQGDMEALGWISVIGKKIHVKPITDRLAFFTERGRNRKVIKTDLDQAHFLIGMAYPNSGLKIESELNNPSFKIKKSVDEILKWYEELDKDPAIRMAAGTAVQLLERWRSRKDRPQAVQLTLFDRLDNE